MLALRLTRAARPAVQLRRLLVTAASAGTGFLLLSCLGYALNHPEAAGAAALRLAWCVVPLAATVYLALAVARTDPSTRPRSGLSAVGLGPARMMAIASLTTALSCTLGSLLALLVFLHLRGDLTGLPFDGAATDFLAAGRPLPLPASLTLLALLPATATVTVALTLRPKDPRPPAQHPRHFGRFGASSKTPPKETFGAYGRFRAGTRRPANGKRGADDTPARGGADGSAAHADSVAGRGGRDADDIPARGDSVVGWAETDSADAPAGTGFVTDHAGQPEGADGEGAPPRTHSAAMPAAGTARSGPDHPESPDRTEPHAHPAPGPTTETGAAGPDDTPAHPDPATGPAAGPRASNASRTYAQAHSTAGSATVTVRTGSDSPPSPTHPADSPAAGAEAADPGSAMPPYQAAASLTAPTPPTPDAQNPTGLPWGIALLATGLALHPYAPHSGLVVLLSRLLTATGLVLAAPGLTHLCGRLLQSVRPGALRLLAGRVLMTEATRIGRPLGVVCAVAATGYAMTTLYDRPLPSFGPLTTLGGLLVTGCTVATLLTAAVEARQSRADTTAALLRLGAPATMLRAAAALRAAALLALFGPLTLLIAALAALPVAG
ncbi:hypothetical protein [Streptomyces sp. NPDC127190]|uniref:hypothetical protein n=1 Tax=unclassified Streptomyces TaxID=2593676 RepID=UPI003638E6DD